MRGNLGTPRHAKSRRAGSGLSLPINTNTASGLLFLQGFFILVDIIVNSVQKKLSDAVLCSRVGYIKVIVP